MGQFGSQANTFWQLLHADPGSSQWSVVTPQGVADNGGLVTAAGVTAASTTVGFLPSQLLRFSPLSATTDAGRNWSPGSFPVPLPPDRTRLASGPDGSLAIVGAAVLHQPSNSSSWSRLVTLPGARTARAAVRRHGSGRRRCDIDGHPTGGRVMQWSSRSLRRFGRQVAPGKCGPPWRLERRKHDDSAPAGQQRPDDRPRDRNSKRAPSLVRPVAVRLGRLARLSPAADRRRFHRARHGGRLRRSAERPGRIEGD